MRINNNINGLTGLRGYAALWVMFFHACGAILPLAGMDKAAIRLSIYWGFDISPIFRGGKGVDIFFVLTGFLLALPFVKQLQDKSDLFSIGDYLKRRFLRIIPAYYVQIIILMGLSLYGIYEKATIGNWIVHFFMIHNLFPAYSGHINGVWWTLPIEFQFYIILPILFYLAKKTSLPLILLGCLIISILYKIIIFPQIINYPVAYRGWIINQLPGRLDSFGMGITAAWLYICCTRKLYFPKIYRKYNLTSNLIIITALILIWAHLLWFGKIGDSFWNNAYYNIIWNIMMNFLIAVLIMGIATNGIISRYLFGNKMAVYFGNISYSLYLWHLPILVLIFHNQAFLNHIGLLKAGILFVTATFIMAHISCYYIERPFMRKSPAPYKVLLQKYAKEK